LGGRGVAGIASTQTARLIRTGRKIDNPTVLGCAKPNANCEFAHAETLACPLEGAAMSAPIKNLGHDIACRSSSKL